MNKLHTILQNQLVKIKPSKAEFFLIEKKAKNLCLKLKKAIKAKKIKAEIFIGGSLAKKTILKKDKYDVDIFVRFNEEYKDKEISELLARIINKAGKATRIHGSRDYFQIKQNNIVFEIIPTIKVSNAKKARNVTDLSYFHVDYVRKAVRKNEKIADDIMLAKAFCYANNCYGAESYISGFSGYALELLIIYYKSFLNFIKAVAKSNNQIVIDIKKWYKNKEGVLLNLNEAKLQSPLVFVDPTFKQRNALAALSQGTFERFKGNCNKFLSKPNEKFFEKKKINEKNYNLIIGAETNKQEGDIAGSKLLKFFRFFSSALEKNFIFYKKDFKYDEKKKALFYFKIKQKKELIFSGPLINKVENVLAFKKKHKNCFIKNKQVFAIEKSKNIKQFLNEFKIRNKEVMGAMGIVELG